MDTLDATDLRLMDLLQRDASLPHKRLAEACGMSEATCSRRLASLKKRGYLDSVVAVLDRKKMGLGLSVFTFLQLNNEYGAETRKLLARWKQMDEVLCISTISGDYDCLLQLAMHDMAAYQEFAERELHHETRVKKYLSVFEMQCLKRSTQLALNTT